jgi:hypothetical protein
MDDSHFDGLSSLVRLSGSNVPARARFIGEAILSSTMTGLTLGLVFGRVGGLTVAGPLVPFLVGTWTGYTFGLVGHWRNCKRLAITYAQRYPTLLAHALLVEHGIVVPPAVLQAGATSKEESATTASYSFTDTMDVWIRKGGLVLMSWSVLAAQACRHDVEEVERQERQRLKEECQEKLHG